MKREEGGVMVGGNVVKTKVSGLRRQSRVVRRAVRLVSPGAAAGAVIEMLEMCG